MTRITVKKVTWDKYNIKHIIRHNVTIKEAESALKQAIAHKKGYGGRYIVIGRTDKRILSVIVRREGPNKYFVVTAWDSDKKERRRLYEKENKRNS